MGANSSMPRQPGANKSLQPVKKPTLAAVLIVKNEAENLRACLASLDGLVDEIVILDSGSQDDTPAIAAEFGARFFVNTAWPGFGRQRRGEKPGRGAVIEGFGGARAHAGKSARASRQRWRCASPLSGAISSPGSRRP